MIDTGNVGNSRYSGLDYVEDVVKSQDSRVIDAGNFQHSRVIDLY